MYAIECYYGTKEGWRLYTPPSVRSGFRIFHTEENARSYVKGFLPKARYRFRRLALDDGSRPCCLRCELPGSPCLEN